MADWIKRPHDSLVSKVFALTWPAYLQFIVTKQGLTQYKPLFETGFIVWDSNMAAVTSRKNALYILSHYTVHSRLMVHSTDRIPE